MEEGRVETRPQVVKTSRGTGRRTRGEVRNRSGHPAVAAVGRQAGGRASGERAGRVSSAAVHLGRRCSCWCWTGGRAGGRVDHPLRSRLRSRWTVPMDGHMCCPPSTCIAHPCSLAAGTPLELALPMYGAHRLAAGHRPWRLNDISQHHVRLIRQGRESIAEKGCVLVDEKHSDR